MLGSLLKTVFFAIGVLVLGNWIQWRSMTLSDHVKITMGQVQRSPFFHQVAHSVKVLSDSLEGTPMGGPSASEVSQRVLTKENKEEILENEQKELQDLLKDVRHRSR